MKNKITLFSTIASLCLVVALMAFGVYAATSLTLGMNSKVSFSVSEVYAKVTVSTQINEETANATVFQNYTVTGEAYSQSLDYFLTNVTNDNKKYKGTGEGAVVYDLGTLEFENTGTTNQPTITYKVAVEIPTGVDATVKIEATKNLTTVDNVSAAYTATGVETSTDATATTSVTKTVGAIAGGEVVTKLELTYVLTLTNSAKAISAVDGPSFVITINKAGN